MLDLEHGEKCASTQPARRASNREFRQGATRTEQDGKTATEERHRTPALAVLTMQYIDLDRMADLMTKRQLLT